MRYVYTDHASTTPLNPEVKEAMLPFLAEENGFGNPSSFHTLGKEAKDAVEKSRQTIADLLSARPDEILFTSGGTESDNMAVLGIARQYKEQGHHLITSTIEHQAILEPMTFLEKKEGFEVTRVSVNHDGLIDPEQVEAAIQKNTT